jgi:predicted transposase/invertase (TIGR01784 family)
MAKTTDIGTKRLISLSPVTWTRWLTGDPTLEVLDILSGEFQWLSRSNDALIKVHSATHGTHLLANEIQFRHDKRMPRRQRAYVALAEEKYELPVYPVVVNILPPSPTTFIETSFHSEFRGLKAHQDFHVINLWEEDVDQVFSQHLTTLLPFVPILKGGQSEALLKQAVIQLRADKTMAEFESLLAFFASFVLESAVVQRILRWDMLVLRESPWYQEILQEGIQKGVQQGLEQGFEQGKEQGQLKLLLRLLSRELGTLPTELSERIRQLPPEQLLALSDQIFDLETVDDLLEAVAGLEA